METSAKPLNAVRQSPPDKRDYKFMTYAVPTFIPNALDLRGDLPPVRDQGGRGTCAAFAASAVKEYQERIDAKFDSWMSPEFIYYHRENKPSAGMYGRDVMKILQKIGSVPDYMYEYRPDENARAPSVDLLGTAARYRIANYAQITDSDELKHALNQSGVCWIAFPVYKHRPEFWRKNTENGADEKPEGGHALAVVGYNEKGFIIRNSWGARWNGDGHVVYPYSDWGAHWEIWSCVDARNSPAPPDPPPCYNLKQTCGCTIV